MSADFFNFAQHSLGSKEKDLEENRPVLCRTRKEEHKYMNEVGDIILIKIETM